LRWLDGAPHFSTGHEEQKGVNLAANPHVVLTTGCGSWQFDVQTGCFRHPEGGLAVVFAVRPAKVFAHAKGAPFGATTHRF
jgi:hypothetical protein